MQDKEQGLRRRRNAGQDASGTYRDIARDVSPPPEMLSGTRTTQASPWRFVLSCTQSGNVDPPPRVKIVDTVVMNSAGGGTPEDFFFTANDGTIRRKGEHFLRYIHGSSSESTCCSSTINNTTTTVLYPPLCPYFQCRTRHAFKCSAYCSTPTH